MISSGKKRGLATSAVAAMAIAGLPLFASSAFADSITAQVPANGVELYSPDATAASTKNDGANTTIHLVAGGGTGVSKVKFQYRVGADWIDIATVDKANGAFSTEFAVPSGLGGASLSYRVLGLDSNSQQISGSEDSVTGVVSGPGSEAVRITNEAGSSVGYFVQPYGGANGKTLSTVSGVTTATSAPSASSPSGSGATTTADVFPTTPSTTATNAFSGIVDLTGYNVDSSTTPTNEAILYAKAPGSTGADDAQPVKVYAQRISAVAAVAKQANVPGSSQTDITVTVVDQNGKAVPGARVVSEGAANPGTPGNPATATAFTKSDGTATFTGFGGSANGTSYAFYVDTTSAVDYQAADDFRTTATVRSYTANLTSLEIKAPATVIDLDETNLTNGFTVSAKDQNGNARALTSADALLGRWTITPFASGAQTTTQAAVFTYSNGTASVAAPTGSVQGTYKLDVYQEKDGSPGQTAGDLSAPAVSAKIGQAVFRWDDADRSVQAQAGTTTTVKGFLVLATDGAALAGRTNVIVDLTPGGERVPPSTIPGAGNAAFSATQPTGTTRISNTEVSATTGTDGSFSASVTDPAVASNATQPIETGVVLNPSHAATQTSPTSDAADNLTVDFVNTGVDRIVSAGAATPTVDSVLTPGRPAQRTITVLDRDGNPVTGTSVNLTLDRGFFTPNKDSNGNLTPASTPGVGDKYGVWKNDGTTKTVTTNAQGQATVTIAIEKDSSFNDDGEATVKLTATSGGKSADINTDFTTDTAPLNYNGLDIVASTNQDAPLPKARIDQTVSLEVYALDQFGNYAALSGVAVSDNTANATVRDSFGDDNPTVDTGFTDNPTIVRADSDVAVDQIVKASRADVATNLWKDDNLVTAGVQPARDTVTGTAQNDVTDTFATISWYTIDFAASTFTLTTNASSGNNPVGSTVTVTYTAKDQNGVPLDGYEGSFFRNGPDDQQDGDGRQFQTDDDGQAVYIFQGTRAGTAEITAILNRLGTNTPIAQSQKNTSVTFGNTTPEPGDNDPTAITIRLSQADNRGNDRIDATLVPAGSGVGREARLYKLVNGVRQLVKTTTVRSNGQAVFVVWDRNKTSNTRYFVEVDKKAGGVVKSTSGLLR